MQGMNGIGGLSRLAEIAGGGVEKSGDRAASTDADASFAALLKHGIERVNTEQHQAAALAGRFESGQPGVDLAEVMIASQKAGLAFRALTQIRNQVVSAYQDVMRMSL